MKILLIYVKTILFIRIKIIIILLLIIVSGCASENIRNEDLKDNEVHVDNYKKPSAYNLKIVAYEAQTNLSKNNDSIDQSFYRIFINEIDYGRTDISISNEIKTFTIMLDNGKKPLIRLEKYILDTNKGKYIRVKNIYQPKAYSCVSPILSDKITLITFLMDEMNGKTEINVNFEKE
jgi:hypothetical protein